MSELPTHLRQEMASLLNDGIIGDLFSEIFSECSPPFVAAILLRLELMVAVKGDILCCEGDVGEVSEEYHRDAGGARHTFPSSLSGGWRAPVLVPQEMFFVLHGTLDVYQDDVKLGELEAGDFFGEGTLMGISERLEATIQVTEDCMMYRLSQKAFQEASAPFPADVRLLQAHAIRRASVSQR
jgi:CRP-like cAMP-binding protein